MSAQYDVSVIDSIRKWLEWVFRCIQAILLTMIPVPNRNDAVVITP